MRFAPITIVVVLLIVSAVLVGSLLVQEKRVSPTVVTTFTPLTLLTVPLLSEGEVGQLVPSGQGIHEYRPSPSDVELLRDASVIIANGAGLEQEWLPTLLESAGRTEADVVFLDQALEQAGIELLLGEPDEHGEQGEVKGSHMLLTDPHIWTSPKNALVMTAVIRDQLTQVFPQRASHINRATDRFRAELSALDDDAARELGALSNTEFIAFHNAFSYFARDYGLRQIATIEATPGEAPTPQALASLKKLVREQGIRALFAEPQFESDIVQQLAADLGVAVGILDPMETMESGETYLSVMRRNLDTLRTALE